MVLAPRCPLCFLLPPPLLLLLLLLPFSTTAQTNSNISLGSSLTAINNKNSYWPSESGEFAFGFQQVEGGFLLAIWFNKIPEKTIVWSANRNQLAPSGSKIQLTTDGRFVLDDPKGNQIWSADSAGAGVSYAAMLDNGNFVLASNDSTDLWQSFDEPTDTILPTQTLNKGSKLLARFSETNYSNGRFLFTLKADGNLAMYIIEYPTKAVPSSDSAYWSSDTVGSGFQVIFSQSGNISVTAKNRTILYQISNAASSRDFYQRAILEYDGVFRQYVYPKDASSSTGKRPMAWTTSFLMPENICTGFLTLTGGGACGFNSYCRLGDDQRPICQCPPGYSLLDPNNKMNGCKQDFVSQSCDEASQDKNRFDFQAMQNTDWPLSDYGHFQSVTEDWCREACLDDCFCAVAIFRGGDCWKKRIPLSNGRADPSVDRKALIKVGATANSTSQFEGGGPKNNDQSTSLGNMRLWIIIAISISLILLLLGFLCYKRKRKLRLKGEERGRQEALIHELTTSERFAEAIEVETSGREGRDLKIFSFSCIMIATNNFSSENKLGQGGFGPVYKGQLPDGQKIAVKRLSRTSGQGLVEFKNELILIAKLQHMNLVRILGCCIHGEEKILIYEYMSNKSLDYYLFDPTKRELLDWNKRSNIIEGVAQGLLYLHKYSRLRIIHRDLKASNILLDDNMNPKISDFGLARIFGQNETEANTKRPVGTYGYMSPEYAIEGTFSIKSDVFSFGVIILEIMTGKKNYSSYHLDRPLNLIGYTWELWKEGAVLELMDPAMGDSCPTHQLLRIIHLGLLCVQDSATDRPTMSDVISMLGNETMPLSDPKQPAFFTGRSVMEVNSHGGKSKDSSVNGLSISTMDAR